MEQVSKEDGCKNLDFRNNLENFKAQEPNWKPNLEDQLVNRLIKTNNFQLRVFPKKIGGRKGLGNWAGVG